MKITRAACAAWMCFVWVGTVQGAEGIRPVLKGTPQELAYSAQSLTNVTRMIVVLKEESAAPVKAAKLAGKSVAAQDEIRFPGLGKLQAKSSDRWKAEKTKKSKGKAIGRAERNLNNLFVAEIEDPTPSNIVQVVRELNRDKRVEYAEPDYPLHMLSLPNDPQFWQQYSLHNTGQAFYVSIPYGTALNTNYPGTPGADINWVAAYTNGYFATNEVLVGVVDTGTDYTHEDLTNRVWRNTAEIAGNGIDDDGNGYIDDIYGYNTADMEPEVMDDNLHGSHVAGTIAAEVNNGWGIAGINPYAKIITAKMFSRADGPLKGNATASSGALGIRYVAEQGAKIQNNSWGGGGYSQSIQDAVELATERGCAVFFAAGNDNTDELSYPAMQDYITAVTSTDKDDVRSFFSNYGWWTDLAAPGSDILSCRSHHPLARNPYYDRFVPPDNTNLLTISGTSMATPTTVGAVSLLIGKFPGMPAWIYGRVAEATANTNLYSNPLNTEYIGIGRVDLARMLEFDEPAAFLFARLNRKGGIEAMTAERGSTNSLFARIGVWTHSMSNLSVEVSIRADSTNALEVVPGKSVWSPGTLAAGQDISSTSLAVRVKSDAPMFSWNYVELRLKQGTTVLDTQTAFVYISGKNIVNFRVDDLDLDGTKEIVRLYDYDTGVYCSDPFSGAQKWKTDIASAAASAYLNVGIKTGNLTTNGPGEEVLVMVYDGSSTNDYFFSLLGHDGSVIIPQFKNYYNLSPRTPVLVEADGDPEKEILFSDTAKLELVEIINGQAQTLWSSNTAALFAPLPPGDRIYYNTKPVAGDFDGNGGLDIAVFITAIPTNGYAPNYIRVFYDVHTNVSRTALITIPESALVKAHQSPSSMAAGDLDNDGLMEFLFVSQEPAVHAYRQDGHPAPGWPVRLASPHKMRYRDPVLADLNHDGYLEVIYQAEAINALRSLFAWDHRGNLLPGYPVTSQQKNHQPALEPITADVDGDGESEIVYLGNLDIDFMGEDSLGEWNPDWDYTYQVIARNRDGTIPRGFPMTFSGGSGFWEIYGVNASEAPWAMTATKLRDGGEQTNQFFIINDTVDLRVVDTMSEHNSELQQWTFPYHDADSSGVFPIPTNTFRPAFGATYPLLLDNGTQTFYSAVFGAAPGGDLIYSWDFDGDGIADLVRTNQASATNIPFSGTGGYDISLTVSNTADGATASLVHSGLVTVVGLPQASFTMDPSSSTVMPVTVRFESDSANTDYPYSTFRWQLGSLTNIYTAESFSHPFMTAGVYDIVLTVSNDYGAPGSFVSSTTQTLTLAGSWAYSTNVYVSPFGASRYPYSSWANAATSLAEAARAVKDQNAACTVWVTNGWYMETAPSDFSVSGTVVRSVNGPYATIVDGTDCIGTLCYLGGGVEAIGLTFQNANGHPETAINGIWRDCRFINNFEWGAEGWGFDRCTIEGNRGGGAKAYVLNQYGWMSNCVIRGNAIEPSWYAAIGRIYNSLIAGNTGGYAVVDGPELVNNTIVNNSPGKNPVLDEPVAGVRVKLWNNVVWSNSSTYKTSSEKLPLYGYDYGNAVDAWHNILEKYTATNYYWSNWSGTGTVSNHPQFVNFSAGDFRLRTNSPGLDNGFNERVVAGWATNRVMARIDFGSPLYPTLDAGWNNFTNYSGNPQLALIGTNGLALTNALGQPVTVALRDVSGTNLANLAYTYTWGAVGTSGVVSAEAGFPATAQRDFIYHNAMNTFYSGETLPYVEFTGLETGKVYVIRLFASQDEQGGFDSSGSQYFAPRRRYADSAIYPFGSTNMPYPYADNLTNYVSQTNRSGVLELGPWPAVGAGTSVQIMIRPWSVVSAVGVIELLEIEPVIEYSATNRLDVAGLPRTVPSSNTLDRGSYEYQGGFAPRCVFTQVTAYAVYGADTVTLGGTASDFDGIVTNLTLDFGDGTTHSVTGTNIVFSHAYAAANVYPVSLTAWDNEGRSYTERATVRVVPAGPGAPPWTPSGFTGLASNPVYDAITLQWADLDSEQGYLLQRTAPVDAETLIVDDASPHFRTYRQVAEGTAFWEETVAPVSNVYGRGAKRDNYTGYSIATYTPPFARDPEWYHIYEWHPAASNASLAALIISHADGSTTGVVDQARDSGQWNYVGKYRFKLGDTVALRNDYADFYGYRYIYADAFKFVRAEGVEGSIPLAADTVEYQDDGLTLDRTYEYRLKATNEHGTSGWTDWLPVYLPGTNPAPTAVINVHSNVLLKGYSWRFSATNSTDNGTIISYQWDLGDLYEGSRVSGSAYSNYNYVFEYDGVYWVELTVTDEQGKSASTGLWITVTGELPAAPGGLTATALNETAIQLNWTDSSYNETGFEIQRDSAPLVSKPAGFVSHLDSGLNPGQTYAYRVRATNEYGSSDWVTASTNTFDATPPVILAAVAMQSRNAVRLTFSEGVEVNTAEAAGNYAINNGLAVLSAERDDLDAAQVILHTGTIATNLLYTLMVSNVEDLYGVPVTNGSSRDFILHMAEGNGIRIDFGSTYTTTNIATGWNNYNTTSAGGSLTNSVDTNGVNTGIRMTLGAKFDALGSGGIYTNMVYPSQAQSDYMYLTNGGSSTLIFSNLNPSLEYNLAFFGSFDTTASRKMTYTAGGITVTNDAWDNVTNIARIASVVPDYRGVLEVGVAAISTRGYLGVLEMNWETQNALPPVETDTAALDIAEGGTTNFNVRLGILPSGTVTVTVERVSGDTDITVQSGSTLVFTTGNWTNWQTVTLAAAEDGDWVNGSASFRCFAEGWLDEIIEVTEQDDEQDPDTLLPFSETFDGTGMATNLAVLNGQHGWTSGTNALVQAGAGYSGNGLRVQSDEASHTFVNGTNHVRISWRAKPVAGITPTSGLSGASAVVWVNTNGNVTVFSNSTAVILPVQVSSNVWNVFDVEVNYVSNVWKLAVNGTNAAENLALYSNRSAFAEFNLAGSMSFDDLNVSNIVATAVSALDNWLIEHYGTTNVNTSAVCSNGVNTILEAYVAGLDPNDPDARFGLSNVRNLLWWNATSGRVYTVYWTSNLLSGFQTLETNYVGGVFTDTVHGAGVQGFYRIEVQLEP